MIDVAETSPALQQIAQDRIETLARSLFMVHGLAAPGGDEIGSIVSRAMAGMSLHELRHPDSITTSAIGQIDQLVLSAADAKKRPQNIYSAEAARLGQAGDGVGKGGFKGMEAMDLARGAMSNTRARDADASSNVSSRSDSGARYDGLGALDWNSPAGMAKMRDFAIQSGVPWAANNPELLRLGPAAVGTLAEVHFKQETYKRLTTDASFKAKDVVVLAHFAKEEHVDANKLGGTIAEAEKPLSPQERARLNGAVVPYMADPKNAAKRDNAVKAFDGAERAHPEDRPALERAREMLHLKGEKLDHENKAAAKKDSRAEEKQRGASAQLADFDALGSEPKARDSAASKEEKPKPTAPAASPPKPQPKAATPAPH